jgi:hypothetical protein
MFKTEGRITTYKEGRIRAEVVLEKVGIVARWGGLLFAWRIKMLRFAIGVSVTLHKQMEVLNRDGIITCSHSPRGLANEASGVGLPTGGLHT